MNLKRGLIVIFSFAATMNIYLAVDLYANMHRVILVSVLVCSIVAGTVIRVDRVLSRALRRWYSERMYGITNDTQARRRGAGRSYNGVLGDFTF